MRPSRQLILIILAYFLIRLPWLFSVPMIEAPDEFAHYWVLKFLAQHMRLPSHEEVIAGGPSAVYGSLPQLGYIPHVLACKVAPIGDLSLVGRFGSLLAGLAAVVASFLIGREIFVTRVFSLALPLLLLFHPQLVFVNSYSNSDSTTCALASVIMYVLIRAIKVGLTIRMSVTLGILLGWTALTKYSALAIFPATLVGLFAALFIHRVRLSLALRYLSVIATSAGLTCTWWFLRSLREFNGDLLGTQTMRTTWAQTYHRPIDYHIPLSHVLKDQLFWSTIHDSFWGLFGYVSRFLHPSLYYTYLGFLLIAIAGGVKELTASAKSAGKLLKEVVKDRFLFVMPAIWLMFAVSLLTNIAAMVAGAAMVLGGAQGRYLFPSEIAIMALLLGGFGRFGKFGKWLTVAFVVYNIVVCIGSYWMLMHTAGYGFTTKLY